MTHRDNRYFPLASQLPKSPPIGENEHLAEAIEPGTARSRENFRRWPAAAFLSSSSVVASVDLLIEIHSFPNSLAVCPRGFAFYVANPIRSIFPS